MTVLKCWKIHINDRIATLPQLIPLIKSFHISLIFSFNFSIYQLNPGLIHKDQPKPGMYKIITTIIFFIFFKSSLSTNTSGVNKHEKNQKYCCSSRSTIDLIWFLVLNATFSNISAISWQPVLVAEEAGVPGEDHRPWTSNW